MMSMPLRRLSYCLSIEPYLDGLGMSSWLIVVRSSEKEPLLALNPRALNVVAVPSNGGDSLGLCWDCLGIAKNQYAKQPPPPD